MTDCGSGDNGFADMPRSSHDLLSVRVDEGTFRYLLHVLGGGWLDRVDHRDVNDTVNRCAVGLRTGHRRGELLLI